MRIPSSRQLFARIESFLAVERLNPGVDRLRDRFPVIYELAPAVKLSMLDDVINRLEPIETNPFRVREGCSNSIKRSREPGEVGVECRCPQQGRS